MSRPEAQQYRVGTGASIMLLIFMVVCLCTLGVLSLLSARADLALSRRSADYMQAYYEAQDAAERRVMQIAADTAVMDDARRAQYARDNGYDYQDSRLTFAVDAAYDRQVVVTLGFDDDGGVFQAINALENTGEWDAGTLNLMFWE